MRFITHRSRMSYWSLSKFSKWLRTKAGLTNPIALTMEDWDKHKEDCQKKAPITHWITTVAFTKAQDIYMFIPDVIYSIRVATIWKFFRTLWEFKKALWNYRNYDYGGLLHFMEIATKDMHECHRDHGHLMRSEETAKELLIVTTLIKRIREDNYTDGVQGFKSVEGKFFGGDFYQIPNTLPSITSKKFYRMRENVKKNDLELLCKILSRKLLTFWD